MKILLTLTLLLIGCTTTRPHTETKYYPAYIKQTDSYSCGPVALYNALQYKGIPESLEVISKMTRTVAPSKDAPYGGTSTNDLVVAAFRLGLNLRLIDKKDMKPCGTYLLRILSPVDGDLNNMFGHFIFMANCKVYNLTQLGSVEQNVTYTALIAFLYEEPGNQPVVFEVL